MNWKEESEKALLFLVVMIAKNDRRMTEKVAKKVAEKWPKIDQIFTKFSPNFHRKMTEFLPGFCWFFCWILSDFCRSIWAFVLLFLALIFALFSFCCDNRKNANRKVNNFHEKILWKNVEKVVFSEKFYLYLYAQMLINKRLTLCFLLVMGGGNSLIYR